RLSSEAKGAPVAAQDGKLSRHFTALDLERLGCHADKQRAELSRMDVPFLGVLEAYRLISKKGCNVKLISMLSLASEYVAADWAGMRASNQITVEENGYTYEIYEGELGDYSEVTLFEKNGEMVGFSYIVLGGGFLRHVKIFSNEIEPDELFEEILASKITSHPAVQAGM
ncbi:MAG: hypothetical protein Q8J78_06880, partial [Moraxellaceae bacterium]|nr:hypothetical protein [Moraxellaceae bacterium]